MSGKREFKESPFEQGEDEEAAYKLTVPTSWGTSSLTSIVITLYENPDDANTDVTESKTSGSASASGQVITTKLVKSLTDGTKYRLEVKFTTSESNVLEAYAIIYAQR